MLSSRTVTEGASAEATRAIAQPALLVSIEAASVHEPEGGLQHIGRYLIIEQIGRGAMGTVSRAYDPRLQREVALKTVRAEELSVAAQARLLREAQAMAKLSHPNVVPVYDVEICGEEVVIAMEFVRGVTLKQWLARARPWPEVIEHFSAAGRALSAAHAAGILHRDFKPSNVLLGDDGRVRVADFGLAHSIGISDEEVERDGQRIEGTPLYMAPEQHDGGALGPAADQYAFCVALWEALTGKHPFAAAEVDLLIELKRSEPPAWPRDVVLSAAIRDAVRRGMAAEATKRWPSMEALLLALAQAPRQRLRKWLHRGSLVATAAALTFAYGLYQRQQARRCTGSAEQVESIWNEQRQLLARSAFEATGLAYAEDAWKRLAPAITGYTVAWTRARTDACEATTLHGTQPVAVMDLRMACLYRAKVELRAVTDVLVRADARVVEKAAELAAALPNLDQCSNLEALQAAVAPPGPAEAAEVQAIQEELAEVRALRAAGKYPESLARVEPLVERSRSLGYAPVKAEALNALGFAFDDASADREAELATREALRWTLKARMWPEAVHVSATLATLTSSRSPGEALAYAETGKGLLGVADADAKARLRSSIARIFHEQGRHEEAVVELRAAIEQATLASGPDDPTVASYRGNLGLTLKRQGRLKEAEHELRAVLDIHERVLGLEHPTTAMTRFDLANTLFRQGRYPEAEDEQRAALATLEHVLGEAHPQTAMARQNLANILASAGRQAEAEAEFRRALLAQQRALGPDNLYVAVTHSSLATALVHQGRHAEAETEARNAVAALERSGRHESPYVAYARNSLALALNGRGRYEEAEHESRAALKLAMRVLGEDHPQCGRMLAVLASALVGQRRHEEAEAELRRALVLQREGLGPEHPQVLGTRAQLAGMLRSRRRYDEAEAEYRGALASQEASGTNHVEVAELQSGLGWTLLDSRRPPEALAVLEAAWAGWAEDERLHPAVKARLAFGLARSLADAAGDLVRARSVARIAHALLEQSPTTHAQELADIEAWLRKHG